MVYFLKTFNMKHIIGKVEVNFSFEISIGSTFTLHIWKTVVYLCCFIIMSTCYKYDLNSSLYQSSWLEYGGEMRRRQGKNQKEITACHLFCEGQINSIWWKKWSREIFFNTVCVRVSERASVQDWERWQREIMCLRKSGGERDEEWKKA